MGRVMPAKRLNAPGLLAAQPAPAINSNATPSSVPKAQAAPNSKY